MKRIVLKSGRSVCVFWALLARPATFGTVGNDGFPRFVNGIKTFDAA